MKTRLETVIEFARNAHKDHWRKWCSEPTPYITHPARVAGLASLLEPVKEDMILAAWLHDTIEDCGVTPAQIVGIAGERVASLVVQLTNPSKQHPGLKRSEKKLMDIQHLVKCDAEAQTLKLLDRYDNFADMTEIRSTVPEQFLKLYSEETRALVHAIGHAHRDTADAILELIADYYERAA